MASDLSLANYVCEQLRDVPGVTHKKMFGEFAFYLNGKIVALMCDNQLFVKPTDAGRALLKKPTLAPPYPSAKPCFLIESELDDADFMSALILATERELPAPKAKSPKKKKTK